MKKVLFVSLLFITMMFTGIVANAASVDKSTKADNLTRKVNIHFDNSLKVVDIGQEIVLDVGTQKKGSSWSDSWDGASEIKSVKNHGEIQSEAVFKAEIPGTYTVIYNISMNEGKSKVHFDGEAVFTIEVKGIPKQDVVVTGANIINTSFSPVYDSDGNIIYCMGMGTIEIIWSDGHTEEIGQVYFFMSPDETSKDVPVSFQKDSINYRYTVTVYKEP